MLMVKTPLAPTPATDRPTKKLSVEFASEQSTSPIAMMIEDATMHNLGVKTALSFPFSGPSALVQIKNEDVNQGVDSKASNSDAIALSAQTEGC